MHAGQKRQCGNGLQVGSQGGLTCKQLGITEKCQNNKAGWCLGQAAMQFPAQTQAQAAQQELRASAEEAPALVDTPACQALPDG